ncbi:MAG: HNH endonuclease [Bacteroidales bacterium]|nr:HNH endonuclease [Bacteroidales bacterium]
MSGYHKLSLLEIAELRNQLILPNVNYPHYPILEINEKEEIFKECEAKPGIIVEVSNFGRVKYNNKIIEPYFVGTFLHCSKVYSREIGDHNVYELVKRAFDPIENRSAYQIHHINNNALDNRPVNLIYVTKEEHRQIDSVFNKELCKISSIIYKNNLEAIITYFSENRDRTINGFELLQLYKNTYKKVVVDNTTTLCKRKFIKCIKFDSEFELCKYIYELN